MRAFSMDRLEETREVMQEVAIVLWRQFNDSQDSRAFRRMTRYEYNYALHDLLGVEVDFANDLPPDPISEDGFENSSETLQITGEEYAEYLESSRKTLNHAASPRSCFARLLPKASLPLLSLWNSAGRVTTSPTRP